MAANPLYNLADALLEAVVAHFAAESIELPENQFVSGGVAAWDCEQVWVSLGSAGQGALGRPDFGPVVCTSPLRPQFTVRILRCVPKAGDDGKKLPDVAALDLAGEIALRDVWHMHRAIVDHVSDPQWLQLVGQAQVASAGIDGPSGGYAAAVYTINTTITPAAL